MKSARYPKRMLATQFVYSDSDEPGIKRKRRGRGFSHIGLDGKIVRDATTVARILSLSIPPAWTDVWICPNPAGHLQATGRDAAGRKQYRYHPNYRSLRDGAKFEHILDFAQRLPELRRRVEADMCRTGLPREKVLAVVVHLLDTTLIRVGNEDYAKQNGSFGLTTLLDRHVAVDGNALRFQFKGKSGKVWRLKLRDRRIARIVRSCQDLPGQKLFKYLDDNGQPRTINSTDINAHLRAATGADITAKDFRTFAGTAMAATLLVGYPSTGSVTLRKANMHEAIAHVAARLRNTPAVTKACYVHPVVLDSYLDGSLLLARRKPPAGLTVDEAAVIAFLRRLLKPRVAPRAKAPRPARNIGKSRGSSRDVSQNGPRQHTSQ